MPQDIIHRFHEGLPPIRAWIDRLLKSHENKARPVSGLGFKKLASCFPSELLEQARVVLVEKVPFPPLHEWNVQEISSVEQMFISGITFANTLFLKEEYASSESLYFHELVHVVQWNRLGADRFLLVYGYGLLKYGYKDCPQEQMAYELQRAFDRGQVPDNLVEVINQRSDDLWRETAPFVEETPGS